MSLVVLWQISEPTKVKLASFNIQRKQSVQYFACRCEWLGTYKISLKARPLGFSRRVVIDIPMMLFGRASEKSVFAAKWACGSICRDFDKIKMLHINRSRDASLQKSRFLMILTLERKIEKLEINHNVMMR